MSGNAPSAVGTKCVWGDLMDTLVQDIKAGDKFRYICDWDFMGSPIWSRTIEASDDAIHIGGTVIVPWGGETGHCFMSSYGSKVEVFCE